MDTILFFDLDATLMINPFLSGVFPRIFTNLQAQTGQSPDELLKAVIEENYRRLEISNGDDPLVMDWDDIVRVVAAQHGGACEDDLVALVEEFCQPPYIQMLDDAANVLHALTLPHRKLVVASMGLSKYQLPVLKALGLYPLFHDLLMPDLTGYLKTDARFYSTYTGIKPRPTFISVGDRYRDDVVVPKSCGFNAVLKLAITGLEAVPALERPRYLAQYRDQVDDLPENPAVLPDAVISTLAELPAVIDALEKSR